ncbi:outer membrane protein [Bradyrhizobium sp.]|uniref:outer membrane protein n=1 Tax=Bradyrhizobium sp. TaxID=376 RepID=UPI0027323D67|nr:outer membrane beta-barrel protein [Bradyrhizobium sp.]MDP3690282.1 outer membrane beta-barrel protein [Bradyrhizobium sp.]
MKTSTIAGVALALTAQMASAADMPLKSTPRAPAAIGYDWSGFYLGGYWGTSIGQSSLRTPSGPFDDIGQTDIAKGGWTAGGTIGANWQLHPNWLVGVEGDVGYLANDRSYPQWNDPRVTAGVKTGAYATARGRLGYVTGPSLLYATGGAAFVQVENIFGGCGLFGCSGIVTAPNSVTTTKNGWTAGGGIETRLSSNWTQKTEYLYIDAGTTNFLAVPFTTPHPTSVRNEFHVIKTGLNYRFGGPGEALPFFGAAMLPTDHNWAGFYAGVNAGGGLTTSPAPGTPVQNIAFGDNDLRGNGFAGGAQAGYNFMNLLGRPNWFAGIEGDFGYLGIKASHVDWNDIFRVSQKTAWYGTARARFGATTGPALLYITGGAAVVRVENGIATRLTPAEIQAIQPGATISSDIRSETLTGWTIGGGTEVALDSRWSARLEYLYIDAGKSKRTAVVTIPAIVTAPFDANISNRFHVVRAGLNYSFNAPVTAKY